MSKQRPFRQLRPGRAGRIPPPEDVAIDGYRIEALIGAGPLTAAYRAVLESHQQAVAVKVLLPHLADSEVFAQRFLQAANAARLVTHDRVLPCYDVGQANGWVYLAGELFDGRTLAELMGDASMDSLRAIHLAWQIALGIDAIHAAGLVHGNLRPSNAVVDAEDGVRLSDLGLPVAPDDPAQAPASPQALHLPPEAFGRSGAPDQSGDIYALGVILLGLLGGRTPWSGVGRQELVELHAAGTPVADQVQGLDGDVAAVVQRATARRPEERYRHAFQVREDLERLQYGFAPIHARSLEPVTSTATREQAHARAARSEAAPSPVRRRPRLLVLGLGASVLAVVGAIVALALGRGDEAPPPSAPAPAVAVPSAPSPAPAAPPVAAPPPGPSWAAAAGVDGHGRWCELDVRGQRLRFRLIAPGSFWMGSAGDEPGRAADEERHLVTISRGFWLADSELPQEAWAAVTGSNPAHFAQAGRPVESVSWNAAQDFIARLGAETGAPLRLPTEAEWEYACRAGATAAVPADADAAWTAAAGAAAPRPVRAGSANAWGLHDMQGNVAEWVEDTYGRLKREPATDPLASGGVHRVVRGGAWNLAAGEARASARGKALPSTALFHLGFRLAASELPAAR